MNRLPDADEATRVIRFGRVNLKGVDRVSHVFGIVNIPDARQSSWQYLKRRLNNYTVRRFAFAIVTFSLIVL